MAKVATLTKLKSAIKKWPSFTKHHQAVATGAALEDLRKPSEDNLCEVYVGKSRRKYMVSSDIICNPIFQELIDKSSRSDREIIVSCEVVLFEHLIWMLKNNSGDGDGDGEDNGEFASAEELAEFYTCH